MSLELGGGLRKLSGRLVRMLETGVVPKTFTLRQQRSKPQIILIPDMTDIVNTTVISGIST